MVRELYTVPYLQCLLSDQQNVHFHSADSNGLTDSNSLYLDEPLTKRIRLEDNQDALGRMEARFESHGQSFALMAAELDTLALYSMPTSKIIDAFISIRFIDWPGREEARCIITPPKYR